MPHKHCTDYLFLCGLTKSIIYARICGISIIACLVGQKSVDTSQRMELWIGPLYFHYTVSKTRMFQWPDMFLDCRSLMHGSRFWKGGCGFSSASSFLSLTTDFTTHSWIFPHFNMEKNTKKRIVCMTIHFYLMLQSVH